MILLFLENNFKITENLIKIYLIGKKVSAVILLFSKKRRRLFDLKQIFNKDGSEAEICGNALRCIGNIS